MQRLPLKACLFLLILVCNSTANLRAQCSGAAEITETRITALRTLLTGTGSELDFQLHSVSPSKDGTGEFLLYSVFRKNTQPVRPPSVYFASVSNSPDERVLFTHEVSSYLPSFAPKTPPIPSTAKNLAASDERQPTINGCLNSFTLLPGTQAIHLNLFAKSADTKTAGANDVIFVLPDHGFVQPLLELNDTSWLAMASTKRVSHRDSLIAVLPSETGVTEVIWEHFSKESGGPLESSNVQTMLYRWDGRKFEKVRMLMPDELADRLKTARILSRSAAITPLRLDYKMPGPNDPAP